MVYESFIYFELVPDVYKPLQFLNKYLIKHVIVNSELKFNLQYSDCFYWLFLQRVFAELQVKNV